MIIIEYCDSIKLSLKTKIWQKSFYLGDDMLLKELLDKPLPVIPESIQEKLCRPSITLTSFGDKNVILGDEELRREVGYARFSNGDYLVSMTCPMPCITPEMISWWFWWHPQEDIRYRVWFPGEHFGISYGKKDAGYFRGDALPAFRPNTQYPTERIGSLRMPLRIDFVSPNDFGFSEGMMCENDIPLIVCGHVSAFRGLVPHTEMAHIFHRSEDGLTLTSRFWIGRTLKKPLLRKQILTDSTAMGMAEHCCVEYRNLAEILPSLYERYGKAVSE